MPDNTKKIVLIGKDAISGRVKTRFQPQISPEASVKIYKAMAIHLCKTALSTKLPVEISFRGDLRSPFAQELTQLGCSLFLQEHTYLGHIIHQALHRADRVIAMGMDMPLATKTEIIQAMHQKEIVFGPAEDGGYWLIAANRPEMNLFEDIEWSTEHVLAQSIVRCKNNNKEFSLTQSHYDIDTAADVHRLLQDPRIPPLLYKRIQQYA